MNPDHYNQLQNDLRFDWGRDGAQRGASRGTILIVVDVLSFSTTIAIGTSRGATIFPVAPGDRAELVAAEMNAELAVRRGEAGISLSPASMQSVTAGQRLVLPSLNGARCVTAAAPDEVYIGALVNAAAVADAAAIASLAEPTRAITVIAAGERWEDDTLRVAIEDLIGAGAILANLPGTPSPEAQTAIAAYRKAEPDLPATLAACGSGVELIGKGFAEDVDLASRLNSLAVVPVLRAGSIQAEGS